VSILPYLISDAGQFKAAFEEAQKKNVAASKPKVDPAATTLDKPNEERAQEVQKQDSKPSDPAPETTSDKPIKPDEELAKEVEKKEEVPEKAPKD
jgi:hypothetical protein